MKYAHRFQTEVAQVTALFVLTASLMLWLHGFDFSRGGSWLLILLSSGLIAVATGRITARIRKSRDQQRAIRERYQAFVETSSEAIWRIELERPMPIDLQPAAQVDWLFEHGYHAECNQRFLEMYGFRSETAVIGQPLAAIFQRNSNNEQLLQDFVRDGYRAEGVISHDIDRRGEVVYVRNSAVGVVEGDHLLRVWGTQIDLTGQKLEALGTLAGGIAHDFNNILSAMMGYNDLALKELEGKELKAARYLREVKRANRRARDLVSQILSFSRRVERQHESLALAEIVSEVLGLMRASLPPSIDVRSEIRAQNARCLADGSQIHQVLLNLCTNAVQAMPEGGELRVELERWVLERSKSTMTSDLPAGDYLRLRVADTGLGMTPATLTRIFDPFFTTKQPGEGTGLGLSTVHGIVLNHCGGIDVESRPGVGTTFAVYLPCGLSEARALKTESPAIAGMATARSSTAAKIA